MSDFFEFLKTPQESVDMEFEPTEQSLDESFRSINENEPVSFSEPLKENVISNPFLKDSNMQE